MERIKWKVEMVDGWFALQSSYVWLNGTRKQLKAEASAREWVRVRFTCISLVIDVLLAFAIAIAKQLCGVCLCDCVYVRLFQYLLCLIPNWFSFHFARSLRISADYIHICCCQFSFFCVSPFHRLDLKWVANKGWKTAFVMHSLGFDCIFRVRFLSSQLEFAGWCEPFAFIS